jgi:AAA domain
MSQREWHAPGGPAVAAPGPADVVSAECAPREDGTAPVTVEELLEAARRRGWLFAAPFPSPSPGDAGHASAVLNQLLSADPPIAEPLPFAEPLQPFDRELDTFQIDAVARAIACPDLFLIQGLPGTGKKRVVAEIICQVAARGQRVLLVGHPNAIEAVLERLEGAPAVIPIRCLGTDESADRLSARSARLTLEHREDALISELRARAAEALRNGEERARLVRGLGPVWEELRELATRHVEAAAELNERRARLSRVEEAVEHDAAAGMPEGTLFAADIQRLARTHAERLAGLEAQAVELQKQQSQYERARQEARSRLDSLRSQDDARRQGRWWTPLFWKARFSKALPDRVADLEKTQAAAEASLAELSVPQERLRAERERAEADFRSQHRRLLAEEATHRFGQLRAVEADLCRRQAEIEARAAPFREQLALAGLKLSELTPQAVDAARQHAEEALTHSEEDRVFARQWAAFVETDAASIKRQFRETVNLVAGPFDALDRAPFLSGDGANRPCYDLLIVMDAQALTEDDFRRAAARAKRWLLVGEPSRAPRSPTREEEPASRATRRPRARSIPPPPDFFARLAQRLGHEPWATEGERLCCRLHPVRPEQRQYLEGESLADNPDMELRILTLPGGEPLLAEIVFPPNLTPIQAREYLVGELNEVRAVPKCRTARWSEESGRIVVRFEPGEPTGRVTLGEGITEWIAGRRTIGFAFDRTAWDRIRAEEWLRESLKHEPGRTAALDVSHRHAPGVAGWLNGILDVPYAVRAGPSEAVVAFLAVPARPGVRAQDNGAAGDGRPRPTGAGYETDLADPKQRERFSPELLRVLPARGFVNLPEADKVVQKLEELTAHQSPDTVGVTAMYSAQAALIRRLALRTPRLAGVRILEAGEWRHRECDTLLVSLTRSHVSRAVTYGDEPGVPQLVLPRARRRVILVGDPGTLARRARWEGACDDFDEVAAERERDFVLWLLNHLQGRGPRAAAFQVLEGDRR